MESISRGLGMIEYQLGDVIAERKLSIDSDPSTQITVLMGAPQRFVDLHREYYVCPIQILGFGDERVRGARAVDAFQALSAGLQLIGIELYVKINPKCNAGLRWNGDADLAFPLPDSVTSFAPSK